MPFMPPTRLGRAYPPEHALTSGLTGFLGHANPYTVGDYSAWVFQAVEAATVTRLGFRYSSSVGTPSSQRIALMGIDANGWPDLAIKGSCYADYTPPAGTSWDNSWRWLNTAGTYACARGEWLCVCILPNASGNPSNTPVYTYSIDTKASLQLPYYAYKTGGTFARGTVAPVFGYGSAARAYGFPLLYFAYTYADAATEVGLRFRLPPEVGSSCRVAGVRFAHMVPGGYSATWTLYGADGSTVLQDVAWATYRQAQYSSSWGWGTVLFDEAALAELQVGTAYRVAVKSPSVQLQIIYNQVAAAADAAAFPLGEEFYLCQRPAAGGAWADAPAQRPHFELLLADLQGAPAYQTRLRRMGVG